MTRDWDDRERQGRGYGRRDDAGRSGRPRDWSDKASDEVRSWFGDDDAERRRDMDEYRDRDRFGYDRRDRGGYGDDNGGYGRRSASYGNDRGGYGYGGRSPGRDSYDPYESERGGYRQRDEGYARGDYEDRLWSGMASRGMTGHPYGGGRNYRQGPGSSDDRGFFDKAGDEIASWFGDDDAQRRREADAGHRGRGPKNYSRSDERIREDVSDRLSDDRHIDASDIEVSVKDGEVTLDGTVGNRFAKRHAEDLAESASGVKHVQNNLRVKDRQPDMARTETRTAGMTDRSGTTGMGGGGLSGTS